MWVCTDGPERTFTAEQMDALIDADRNTVGTRFELSPIVEEFANATDVRVRTYRWRVEE